MMVVVALCTLLVGALVLLVRREQTLRALRRRFAAIVDVDAEIARMRGTAEADARATREQADRYLSAANRDSVQLQASARAAVEAAQHEAGRIVGAVDARVAAGKLETAAELAKQEQLRAASAPVNDFETAFIRNYGAATSSIRSA